MALHKGAHMVCLTVHFSWKIKTVYDEKWSFTLYIVLSEGIYHNLCGNPIWIQEWVNHHIQSHKRSKYINNIKWLCAPSNRNLTV